MSECEIGAVELFTRAISGCKRSAKHNQVHTAQELVWFLSFKMRRGNFYPFIATLFDVAESGGRSCYGLR